MAKFGRLFQYLCAPLGLLLLVACGSGAPELDEASAPPLSPPTLKEPGSAPVAPPSDWSWEGLQGLEWEPVSLAQLAEGSFDLSALNHLKTLSMPQGQSDAHVNPKTEVRYWREFKDLHHSQSPLDEGREQVWSRTTGGDPKPTWFSDPAATQLNWTYLLPLQIQLSQGSLSYLDSNAWRALQEQSWERWISHLKDLGRSVLFRIQLSIGEQGESIRSETSQSQEFQKAAWDIFSTFQHQLPRVRSFREAPGSRQETFYSKWVAPGLGQWNTSHERGSADPSGSSIGHEFFGRVYVQNLKNEKRKIYLRLNFTERSGGPFRIENEVVSVWTESGRGRSSQENPPQVVTPPQPPLPSPTPTASPSPTPIPPQTPGPKAVQPPKVALPGPAKPTAFELSSEDLSWDRDSGLGGFWVDATGQSQWVRDRATLQNAARSAGIQTATLEPYFQWARLSRGRVSVVSRTASHTDALLAHLKQIRASAQKSGDLDLVLAFQFADAQVDPMQELRKGWSRIQNEFQIWKKANRRVNVALMSYRGPVEATGAAESRLDGQGGFEQILIPLVDGEKMTAASLRAALLSSSTVDGPSVEGLLQLAVQKLKWRASHRHVILFADEPPREARTGGMRPFEQQKILEKIKSKKAPIHIHTVITPIER